MLDRAVEALVAEGYELGVRDQLAEEHGRSAVESRLRGYKRSLKFWKEKQAAAIMGKGGDNE